MKLVWFFQHIVQNETLQICHKFKDRKLQLDEKTPDFFETITVLYVFLDVMFLSNKVTIAGE